MAEEAHKLFLAPPSNALICLATSRSHLPTPLFLERNSYDVSNHVISGMETLTTSACATLER